MKKFQIFFLCLFAATTLCLNSCTSDDEMEPSTTTTDTDAATEFADYFDIAGNQVADPGFGATDITPSNDLGTTSTSDNPFISTVSYKGAIDPTTTPWYAGWSSYASIIEGGNTNGFDTQIPVDITDEVMANAGDVVNWTADNTYIIDGFVFVNEGQTLNIEAGTIIQGKAGEDVDASALVVARGATINAMGTEDNPIIFTYEGDNGGEMPNVRGQWGGLILLGSAELNSTPGESAIEGIPTDETRGLYGGSDNADNSGTLRYVSIRHGGTNIGSDNEINGLTLGGVGSGTTIEYVEVIGNQDDGVEWFGGTVNAKHLIVAFCGDDGLDYDEGFRGATQFVIVHQDPAPEAADRGGEHDGGTDPEVGRPYATPQYFNVTSVGNTGERALTFRDNAGGQYHNSIFVNYAKGIDIEDLVDQDQDSFQQFKDGELRLENNVFFNIGAGTTASDLFKVSN